MHGKVNQWTSIYCEYTAFLQQPIVVVEQQSFSINLNYSVLSSDINKNGPVYNI